MDFEISAQTEALSLGMVNGQELQKAIAGFHGVITHIKAMADELAESMDGIDVRDDGSSSRAARKLQEAQTIRKNAHQFVKPVKDVLNDLKGGVLEKEKDALRALELADAKLRAAMLAYKHTREAERTVEQARLQQEQSKRDADALWAEAMALREEGRDEEADQLLAYQRVSAPVVLPKVANPEGFIETKTWKARCNSLMSLVCAIAAGKESIKAVKWDQAYLDKMAQTQQETFAVAGCEAYPVSGTQVRRRKEQQNDEEED